MFIPPTSIDPEAAAWMLKYGDMLLAGAWSLLLGIVLGQLSERRGW